MDKVIHRTQEEVFERIGEFKEEVSKKYGTQLNSNYGKKFCKLTHYIAGEGVWGFIDLSNGDILKAESWSKPAKHARGNIFADDYGMSGVGQYGPNYLK